MSEQVLSCRNVSKSYGKKPVLREIALSLDAGQVFGLLGPNGAGKTTFIKIILGLVMPDQAEVSLFGRDLFTGRRELMRHVGAVVEAPVFFDYMSAMDNLRGLVSLSGPVDDREIRRVLELVGLQDVAGNPVRTFSYGMKQRLGIAQALLPDTRFLLLDEPTNGLDPHGIAGMRQFIRRLSAERGITILVSSHLLVEVEQVCDRVMIIHQGRSILEETVDELKKQAGQIRVTLLRNAGGAPEFISGLGGTELPGGPSGGDRSVFVFPGGDADIPGLVSRLVGAGVAITAVELHEESLEEIFIRHTQSKGDNDVRIDAFRD